MNRTIKHSLIVGIAVLALSGCVGVKRFGRQVYLNKDATTMAIPAGPLRAAWILGPGH